MPRPKDIPGKVKGLFADVWNRCDLPQRAARSRADREQTRGRPPGRIDDLRVLCGVKTKLQRIKPGRPSVQKIADDRCGVFDRIAADAAAVDDMVDVVNAWPCAVTLSLIRPSS